MIRTIERRGDFAARAAPSKVDRDIASYISQAARAYLALVRHDTTEALQRLQALPDTHCPLCYQPRLTLGHLLSARLDDRTAAAQPDAPGGGAGAEPFWPPRTRRRRNSECPAVCTAAGGDCRMQASLERVTDQSGKCRGGQSIPNQVARRTLQGSPRDRTLRPDRLLE